MSTNTFIEKPWPPLRNLIVDFLAASARQHNIQGFFEVDITKCKSLISVQQKKDQKAYSLIAYLAWCYAKAVDENKVIHSFKKGKKLILFDEVDINLMLEKKLPDGTKIPVAYIVRSANKKTYMELNHEIRKAMKDDQADNEVVKARRKIASYPKFVRRWFWRKIENDPVQHKKHRETVALTAIGMFTRNRVSWAMPVTPMPCTLAAGSTYEKVVSVNGEFQKKQMWCLTLVLNHDITDGAPASRFGNRFCELMESCEGLIFENKEVQQTIAAQ